MRIFCETPAFAIAELKLARAVSVDSAAIIEALRNVYDAQPLVDEFDGGEMNIVLSETSAHECRSILVRQVVEEFEDVGKYTHCGHIWPGTWTLNDERRAGITLRGESDDVVAASRGGEWMIAWELFNLRASAAALKGTDVSEHRTT